MGKKNSIRITSMHVIPFDIGINDDTERVNIIKEALCVFPSLPMKGLQQYISAGLLFGKKINSNISLYIYEIGVGVFVVWDSEPFTTQEKYYATSFCKKRSKTHDDIYTSNHLESESIKRIMIQIWNSLSKYTLRKTASLEWGLDKARGLLYAMTVDFLETKQTLSTFDEVDKKNLLILLNPTLVEMEDHYSKVARIEDSRFI